MMIFIIVVAKLCLLDTWLALSLSLSLSLPRTHTARLMQLVWSATCLHWRRQWLNSSEREGTSLELIHLLPTTGEMNNYCGANNKCYSFTQYKSNMESVFKKCTHTISQEKRVTNWPVTMTELLAWRCSSWHGSISQLSLSSSSCRQQNPVHTAVGTVKRCLQQIFLLPDHH